MMKARSLMIMLVVAMTSTAAHSEPPEAATAARTAAPVTVYVNARVHTGDEALPRAQAFVTRSDRFAFVGSAGDALRYAAGEGGVVDLQGRFVMPGIIDAHTHPGLVALSGDLSVMEAAPGENERPAGTDRMPSRPKEATLAWLQRYADDHLSALAIVQGTWDVAAYLPHGPHKRDLDRISRTKPIMLHDKSGHSYWVNSALLRALGIDRNTPDVSTNLSHFVRDGNGEPTGWVKEFALIPYAGAIAPDAGALKSRLLKYLNYMSSMGITTLWDREAARFDLLAWADPHEADGPASPFRAQPEMVEAVLEPDVEPLVPLVAAGVFDPPIGLTSLQLRDGSAEDGGSLELSFEARRRESAIDGTPPVHEVGLRLTARR